MKKVLVLAPHPDDEILLAGGLIYYIRKQFDVRVAFLTNGDSNRKLGGKRIQEAIDSLNVLGVKENRIEFLGYGNNWKEGKHIYNMPNDDIVMSIAGRTQTYGNDKVLEYSKKRTGYSRDYKRINVLEDIKDLIVEEFPEIIICVDYDSHPDHRALSLFFEETMGIVLKEYSEYKPIVLKKFAYNGVYYGKSDYYELPLAITECEYQYRKMGVSFQLENPTYLWEERIQLDTPKKARTRSIAHNILYKAACKHCSQNISKHIGAIANRDIVYWQRRTDSLSYQANIYVSSGIGDYLNDFKRIDSNDVVAEQTVKSAIWKPNKEDKEKKIQFKFDKPVDVSAISIWENIDTNENILESVLRFNDVDEIVIDNIEHSGKETFVTFPMRKNIFKLDFVITKWQGDNYGIAEFEIYSSEKKQGIPFKLFEGKRKTKNSRNVVGLFTDKIIHNIIQDTEKNSRYYKMYELIYLWSNIPAQKFETYFRYKKINTAIVYGLGELGVKLCAELEKINVAVILGLDNLAGTKKAKFQISRLDQLVNLPKSDIVIVTTMGKREEIYNQLQRKGIPRKSIIDIEKLIYDIDNLVY